MLDLKFYLPNRPNRRYKMGRSRASSLLSDYSRDSEVSPERTQLWENDEVDSEENRCYFEDEEKNVSRDPQQAFSWRSDMVLTFVNSTNSGKAIASDMRSRMSSALKGSKKRPHRMSRYGVLE
ncbi:hypothetical protein KEM54_006296 [Ascosphaera aggregata]|nr:hypothetical protein KEM54_006296 [Ascosphaera aggregata]